MRLLKCKKGLSGLWLDWATGNPVERVLNSFGLEGIVDFPTRITPDSQTLIDNIFLEKKIPKNTYLSTHQWHIRSWWTAGNIARVKYSLVQNTHILQMRDKWAGSTKIRYNTESRMLGGSFFPMKILTPYLTLFWIHT